MNKLIKNSCRILPVLLLISLNSCTLQPPAAQSSSQPAPQQAAKPVSPEFVGEVKNTDALVAFAIQADNKVRGYICGGDNSWDKYTSWFNGEISGGKITLKGQDNQVLTGTLSEADIANAKSASGTLTLAGGTNLEWQATLAATDKGAGLYRYEDSNIVMGAIVNNDFRVQGVARKKDDPAAHWPDNSQAKAVQVKINGTPDSSRCLELTIPNSTGKFHVAPISNDGKPCK